MSTSYRRIFKRPNWGETTASLLTDSVGMLETISDDLNSWLDAITPNLPELALSTSDDLNSADDVMDGFMEDAAWNDTISEVLS